MKRHAVLGILAGGLIAALGLHGCGRHPSSTPAAAGSAPLAAPASASTALRGTFVFGADQAALRTYLQNVQEVKPPKFEVEWSKDVVPVSREEALRALRSVNADGSDFVFTSSDPVVQRLQPGKIVWIWGIAIRRIDRLGIFEDGTVVHTSAVPLSEALTRADIEFATPVDFGNAYGVYKPRIQEPPPRTITRAARPSGFVPVRYGPDPEPPPQGGPAGAEQPVDPGNQTMEQTAESDMVAATGNGYTGTVAGFQFSMGYKVSQNTLHLELQGRKADENQPSGSNGSSELQGVAADRFYAFVEEQWHAQQDAKKSYDRVEHLETQIAQIEALKAGRGGDPQLSGMNPQALSTLLSEDEQQKLIAISDYRHAETLAEAARAKARAESARNDELLNLFLMVAENLDVRFRARADLERAALQAAIKLNGGSNAGTSVNFKDLKGTLDLELVARLGQGGNGGVSIPVAHVPVRFNIPVIVGGVPLVVQLGADFLAKIALAGNHAAHHFHAKFQFAGGAGTLASASSQTDSNGAFDDAPAQVEQPTLSSPGVSGTVLAVQIPRLGLGVGVFGIAAVGYVDHVVVLTMTNAAAVATLNPPCTRVTVDRIAHVGADVTTVMPIPLVEQLLHALSWNKEVWRAKQWIRVDPDIKMCRI
ncbi:MAG: hypothetical protein JSR36_01960 [Proteobacteria bacterium]|nr:hypothetical protein [Pseudomonadota bacterium]